TRDLTTSKHAGLQVLLLKSEHEQRVAERTAELQTLSEVLVYDRNLLRTLIDAEPDRIYDKDKQSRFLLANQAHAQSARCEDHQGLLGKSDLDFFPEEVGRKFYQDEQELMRSGVPILNKEEPMVSCSTGKTRWLLTSKYPVRNSDNEIIGVVGIGRDITLRRET